MRFRLGRLQSEPMYRDDHEALRARSEALEKELAHARSKLASVSAERRALQKELRALEPGVIPRGKRGIGWLLAMLGGAVAFGAGLFSVEQSGFRLRPRDFVRGVALHAPSPEYRVVVPGVRPPIPMVGDLPAAVRACLGTGYEGEILLDVRMGQGAPTRATVLSPTVMHSGVHECVAQAFSRTTVGGGGVEWAAHEM